ncbi:tRNA (adenosine(37)-N6)-dimethylallyltransferase MiaA [Kushneria indalinina]|uniref:tRNA dimethylallyltransferase n=1 Tax=Kushneria indalinina DSM 14324 TaxID=1122140 RepID=A0A3D9DUH7_9GAMM|nr:tRNA (adenosine(37)-N6)-dimethylallyltransferase MiaA [Kushneria indalinina]REC94428.1 tRNA dimethylallyltransferase [Kushneria indalinina DSM 14324]
MNVAASHPPVIMLMGPTAVGKTDLAIELHEQLGVELVSVDSALVYKGMDIGTAKPSAQELARAPHRLIDIRDPSEPYSGVAFRDDALECIEEITARGRVPLLVGGTMLYFRLLTEGAADMPQADPEIRQALGELLEQGGAGALHAELARVDPEAAARLHPNDPQRLMRALEVYRASGETLSAHWARQSPVTLPFTPHPIALLPNNRSLLHERIQQRLDKMFAAGFVEEVKALRARGDLSPDLPSMKSVGYRQVWEGLDRGDDCPQMAFRALTATRQLAKRQMTWLRRWPGALQLDPQETGIVPRLLKIVRDIGT